tara:strand:+ start:545 stop:760 length:216 start_codon:yes stop_codon:yes gene_type:complete
MLENNIARIKPGNSGVEFTNENLSIFKMDNTLMFSNNKNNMIIATNIRLSLTKILYSVLNNFIGIIDDEEF